MRQFVVVNENLVFKSGNYVTTFRLGKDSREYALIYIRNYDTDDMDFYVSYLEKSEDGYNYLIDISLDEERDRVVKIVSECILETDSKRNIKIYFDKKDVSFEENICQTIVEKGSVIAYEGVLDKVEVINSLALKYGSEGVLLEVFIDESKKIEKEKKEQLFLMNKRSIMKGNVSVFCLTLFAVLFLGVCCFMGVAQFFGG